MKCINRGAGVMLFCGTLVVSVFLASCETEVELNGEVAEVSPPKESYVEVHGQTYRQEYEMF